MKYLVGFGASLITQGILAFFSPNLKAIIPVFLTMSGIWILLEGHAKFQEKTK